MKKNEYRSIKAPLRGLKPNIAHMAFKSDFDIGLGRLGTITSLRATMSGILNKRQVEWLASG